MMRQKKRIRWSKLSMKLTKKRNVWDPMNVFLLTLLTSVNVWRRQTLPEIVSSKVPEITFRHCVTRPKF